MAEHRPNSLTEHASPPFRPHTPDPNHEATTVRRPSIARVDNAIRQIIFGGARVKKHAADELVHNLQRKDEEHYARFVSMTPNRTSQSNEPNDDQVDASEEAKKIEESNKAGFGDQDEGQHGWPGLANREASDAKRGAVSWRSSSKHCRKSGE